MPAPAPVYLRGGPCNGTKRKLTPAENQSKKLTCGGATYVNPETGAQHNGFYIWQYQQQQQQTGGQGFKATQALHGWKALRKAVNRKMPEALDYSQHVTAAALRTLHRARKVRL